jgi:HEPN domain-containing protein
VALKQLYANHYFQTALDLTVCMKDAARPNEHGFYLITVKASQQAGLTGLKGSILRKVAVGKSRSSLEHTLTAIKERLETAPGA